MFPRITKFTKNGKTYEYLVISRSTYNKGKGSTTENISVLGNIKQFKAVDASNLIDGFIRIFQLENYSLSDGVEILQSLEYGEIIFWRKIWDQLDLSSIIKQQVCLRDTRVKLEVEKYVQMMVINRLVDPLSKLGVSRWIETTCYKEMKDYYALPLDVNYFYRSMDHLLKIKDSLELALFEKLRNLFSINVKLTFYDITSTFFYSDACPISKNGFSRDKRPDKVQIVIGVVTSYEGYPIKHYIFEGNTKDETTVAQVVDGLKKEYTIEETVFVGDRGMITKLNLDKITGEGFDYIMGVKNRQDGKCKMLFSEEIFMGKDFLVYKGLKIKEKHIKVKDFLFWKVKEILKESKLAVAADNFASLAHEINKLNDKKEPDYQSFKIILKEAFPEIDSKIIQKIKGVIKKHRGEFEKSLRYIICLNEEREKVAKRKREEYIVKFSKELEGLFSKGNEKRETTETEKTLSKIFEGYKAKFRKFFDIQRDKDTQKAIGFTLNQQEIFLEKRFDGIFTLLTSSKGLEMTKVLDSYKNLKEVEMLFDDLKNFVDIRPVRHWLKERVCAHVSAFCPCF
ncbi:MAG: hypothetical protein IEMM0008_1077 [bacterium]|nr:MAG: hypothetical protein IEMM0008_1077 [bacterium]